jgi:hypothetical protein
MSILNMLTQTVAGDNLDALAGQLGLNKDQASSAISAALPMIMGALAKNTSSQEGAASLANALDKDHDGSILDMAGAFLSSSDNGSGAGILKHLFGNKRGGIESAISSMAGINSNQAGGMLENLAPLVMGMLGQQKRQQGLDIAGLASLIGGESQQASSTASTAMGLLGNILDRDGDGSMLDDLGGMLGGLLGKK